MQITDSQGRRIPVKTYKDLLPTENADDRAYVEIIGKINDYTMTLKDGLESTIGMFDAVRYIVHNKIPGDIVECGVWRGGSMMLVAYALKHFGDASRQLWLYDTYSGMTEPEDVDVDFDGVSLKAVWATRKAGEKMGFGGSVEDVQANMLKTSYPKHLMQFIAGDVLETIPAQAPSRISLLRLDTDWYKSTLHELRHLYDRVAPYGVIIIDDYGWCRGAREATDEFFRERSFWPMMHRVDQGPRMIIKPALSDASGGN